MANQIIIDIGAVANDGTGDPLRTAFGYVNDNFSNIWSTGVANSNVAFSGNKIITVNTNGNLVLAPNGTGKVVANVDIVPNTANTRNLGALTNRWSTVYSQYLNVSNDVDFTGDVTINGNLTVEGDTIQIGNIVTDTKTIQLANTASTANAANGSGITVGASDNIATMLYNSTSNTWTMNIGANITGNVTAPYFIGNGSLLTGVSSYANANAVAYANAGWAGNIIPATSNVYSLGNATNQWNDLYISNATIYMNNVPISLTAANVLTVNGANVVTATAGGNINVNNIVSNSNIAIDTSAERVTVSVGLSDWVFDETGVLTAPGEVETVGNISAGYFLGNGSQLTGIDAGTGNLDIVGTDISIATGAPETLINISPSGEGWAYLQLPKDSTANSANTRLHNDAGNVEIGTGDFSTGSNSYEWVFDNTGTLIFPSSQTSIYGGLDNDFTINTANANAATYTFTFSQFGDLTVPVDLYVIENLYADSIVGPGNGNVTVTANTQSWTFGTDGVVTLPGNSAINSLANAIRISASTDDLTGIYLVNAGDAELYANANVSIYTDSNNTGQGWTFDTTGNLILPAGGDLNFVAGGIAQTVDEDFTILVQDGDDDGFSIYLNVDDGSGTVLSQYQQQRDQYELGFPDAGVYYQFNDNGTLVLPANAAVWSDASSNVSIIARSVDDDSFVELMSQDNSDIKRSNVTVTRDNVTVTTSSGAYNWTFDVNGDLIVPGGNTTIYTANAVGNTAGNSISIIGGAADQTDYYATPGGNVNITGGLGAFNDGGGGGQGGSINLTSGLSSDPAGVAGNINITAGSGTMVFDYGGNLTVSGSILTDNIRTIEGAVHVGQGAGLTNQGLYGIAVGRFAGGTDQGAAGLAIGQLAGSDTQGTQAIALGLYAGANTQSANAVAIGTYAGQTTQGTSAIAIGRQAGIDNQGAFAVAVGWLAGNTSQGGYSVSIGPNAGSNTQGQNSVAIGVSAAREAQGNAAIAIGQGSGTISQGAQGIAIGDQAGQQSQAANAIAIGTYAGYESAGISSISIGTGAGYYIANNAIVINATGANLDGNTANTFTVAPVRNDVANIGQVMFYNTTSKEVTYGNTISVAGNITGGNLNATTGIANVANLYLGNGYVNTAASAALNLVPGGSGGTRVWSKLVPNANVAFSLGSSTEYWANGYIGNLIGTTGNFTGNVTAANFSGNISITGNVTGTSANVTLVAGAYSAVFDNTGVATFPGDLKGDILISTNSSGSEGGEIQLSLPTAGNTTLSGTNIIIDSYSDRIRFFEGGGNARGMYIDLANSPDGQVNAAIGYRDVPQIALSANVTANLTNAGKHFYSTTAGNLAVLIPTNANVAFPTGATLTLVVNAAGNVLVNADTGVSLYMAGSSTTGNRTVGAYGLASVMKVATDTWVISGTGVY